MSAICDSVTMEFMSSLIQFWLLIYNNKFFDFMSQKNCIGFSPSSIHLARDRT